MSTIEVVYFVLIRLFHRGNLLSEKCYFWAQKFGNKFLGLKDNDDGILVDEMKKEVDDPEVGAIEGEIHESKKKRGWFAEIRAALVLDVPVRERREDDGRSVDDEDESDEGIDDQEDGHLRQESLS